MFQTTMNRGNLYIIGKCLVILFDLEHLSDATATQNHGPALGKTDNKWGEFLQKSQQTKLIDPNNTKAPRETPGAASTTPAGNENDLSHVFLALAHKLEINSCCQYAKLIISDSLVPLVMGQAILG